MDYVMGINNYWALTTVALLPTTPDAPPTNTLTVSKYRLFSGYSIAGGEATAFPLSAVNTPANMAPTGMVRVRAEITTAVATTPPFGFTLYCRKNADAYTQALDTFGSNVFRLFGAGVDLFIPSSTTATTPQLTAGDADTVAGVVLRDQSSVFIAPQMASGKRIELEWLVVLNAAVGDTIDCQPRFDSGGVLTTYTVTPRLTVITPAASGAF